MKRFLVAIILSIFLVLSFGFGSAFAGAHVLKFQGFRPVTVPEECPQKIEGNFKFYPVAADEVGGLRYMLIVALSPEDEHYAILILIGTTDEGKTLHVLAMQTEKIENGSPVNIVIYKDQAFFSGKGPSGILTAADQFPGPDDLAKVAPPKAAKRLEI